MGTSVTLNVPSSSSSSLTIKTATQEQQKKTTEMNKVVFTFYVPNEAT